MTSSSLSQNLKVLVVIRVYTISLIYGIISTCNFFLAFNLKYSDQGLLDVNL